MTVQHQAAALRVDIVSDVVCPWCIIGYKQLQKALTTLEGEIDVTIAWHPFELNPQMPAQGQGLREHLVQKYGPAAAAGTAMRTQLMTLGESLGFTFDYFDDMRMVNTFSAHQLLHWALEFGKQTELKLALFEAFFSRREDVSDPELLSEVAGRAGLDARCALEVVLDGRYAQGVREEQQQWLDKEVHAVPTFFLRYGEQKYVVPGAQEAESFVRILKKMRMREAAIS